MAAVSSLRWAVQPDVMGCPVPLIDRAIASAAREWCDLTQSAREDVEFTAEPGVQSYDISLSSQSFDVARIFSVSYGTDELEPMRSGTLASKLTPTTDRPRFFWLEDSVLWFDCKTQDAAAVVAVVAVKPKIDSATIPDDTAKGEAALAVAARAKRSLMMTKQPWGDASFAAWNEAEFQRLARDRINLLDSKTTNAPLRSTPVVS